VHQHHPTGRLRRALGHVVELRPAAGGVIDHPRSLA
jgi:hypothetical protein